jgi:hypothetical protein
MVDLNRSCAQAIGLSSCKPNYLHTKLVQHKTTSMVMDVVRYYLELLFFIFFVFLFLLIFFVFLVVLILLSSHTSLQIIHKGNTLKLSF